MDIFDKIDETKGGALGRYQSMAHGYFAFPKLEGEIGPQMKFRGKNILNWSLNDYLGLANLAEVRQADTDAAEKWGLSYPMGSRILTGQTSLHEKLEDEIAKYVCKDDAFLINSGYQGMISLIDTLCSRFDVIVYDSEAHPSVMDAIFLHKAKGGKSFVFPHNNIENCRKKLQMAQEYIDKESRNGGILVITEGVFGTLGDLGALDKIVALKSEFSFRMLVDDAHGFGVMGDTGSGTTEHFGVTDSIDMIFGTFTNSLASTGGFVATTEKVANFLRYNMRSQLFSKALPMSTVQSTLARLEIMQNHPEYREQLWTITHALQKGLNDNGFDIGQTQSPVTPIYFTCSNRENEEASLNEALNMIVDLRENHGIFCSVVKYPVVPVGTVVLRLIPTAAHTLEDVDYTIETFCKLKEKLENGEYNVQVPNVFDNIK